MKTLRIAFVASTVCIAVSAAVLFGQAAPPAGQQPPAGPGGPPPAAPGPGRGGPQQPMSFFITSAGIGRGGDLGGLAGADAQCQTLAAAAGRGNVTWHAYLSTQGPNAVNARDRIGNGPWYNQKGQLIAANVAELHGDTLEQARVGNFIGVANSLDEKGNPVPNTFPGSEHDMLTGSTIEGRAYTDNSRDYTCNNWTSSVAGAPPAARGAGAGPGAPPAPPAAGAAPAPVVGRGAPGPLQAPGVPSARVGHADKGNIVPSWNSSHSTNGCAQPNFVQVGGGGRMYCFVVN